MTWRWKPKRVCVLAAGILSILEASCGTAPQGPAQPPGQAWRDDFSTNQIDTTRWEIANRPAPGYIPNYHVGYYDPTHVSAVGGYLVILLTQENGTVDGTGSGVISRGGLLSTRQTYGYGTYQWRMRMSSTAIAPLGGGAPQSGSVSAGFIYTNDSQTEIDFEFLGMIPDTIWLANWLNPNPLANPTPDEETFTRVGPFDSTDGFHTYRFDWEPGKITYFIDDVLEAEHTTNVPQAPANFLINHFGTDSATSGGTATVGVPRYVYVDWVSYTPD